MCDEYRLAIASFIVRWLSSIVYNTTAFDFGSNAPCSFGSS